MARTAMPQDTAKTYKAASRGKRFNRNGGSEYSVPSSAEPSSVYCSGHAIDRMLKSDRTRLPRIKPTPVLNDRLPEARGR